MSKLSALLNPEPNLNQPVEDGDGMSKGGSSHDYHDRHPSLTSPLEALAIAATNSPPSLSPTDLTTAPLTSAATHHRTFSNSSSRPDSSHYSLPMPNALNHAQPSSSSPYDHSIQYHRDSNERMLSDIVDGGSRELPPLRRSFPNDNDSSGTIPSGENCMPREQPDLGEETQSHQLPSLKAALSVDHEFSSSPYASEHLRPHDEAIKVVEADGSSCRDPQYGTRPEVTLKMVDDSTNAAESNNDATASTRLPADAMNDLVQKFDSTEATIPAVEVKREDSAQDVAMDGQPSQPFKEIPFALQRTASKKRPAPKTDKKRGTATTIRKPAAKKRKIENDSLSATPFSQRSGTPSSSRASKTPAPRNRKQSSTTPAQSSPPPSTRDIETLDDEDADDDAELFCICRKPDDHTWMIGCDGGCEDWFHGRCVGINESDGNLIDKYICPNCKDKGLGQTTWKPMCRLETCREPARVAGTKPSKYCSNEHGEEYMALRALGKDSKRNESNKAGAARKRRKDNLADHTANGEDGLSVVHKIDDQAYLRGGLLRPPELKALASGVTSLSDFKALGDGVLSPPQTASPDSAHSKQHRSKGIYTSEETTQLSDIALRKAELKRQRALLDDREKFLGLVKARAKTVLEDLKIRDGVKDICGFDSRLSWSDEEFDAWRSSGQGKRALDCGILSAPLPEVSEAEVEREQKMVNGEVEEVGKGVCQKKRCERHKKWYQLQQQEIAFEKEQGRQAMRKLEEEEKGLGERATLRFLENGAGGEEPEDGEHTAAADTGGVETRELLSERGQ